MAMPRLRRKARQPFPALFLLVALGWVGLRVVAPADAAVTERVVVDRHSGLAISGFDPVAYFTNGRALAGKGDFEQELAGAVWRFRNVGNRAAFAADPNVYMPRFGGYDPVGVARGVAVPGNPELWLIVRERLYLFYTTEDRDLFANDGQAIIATANRAWPSIERNLAQ